MPLSFRSLSLCLLFCLPFAAQAHEHATYRIGQSLYDITLGMIDEPSLVDHPSGVEVLVERAAARGQQSEPIVGLESTLKVDVTAGGATRTFSLSPAWGSEGLYKAQFVPTAATTYSFRLYGTLEDAPFDVTFTCNPAGHPKAEPNTVETPIGDAVMQVSRAGSFGCPLALEDVTFPDTLQGRATTSSSAYVGWVGAVTGVAGMVLAAFANVRRRKA